MDAREARRAAEKAAKEQLANSLIGLVGDLGVSHAKQGTYRDAIGDAEKEAKRLIEEAQAKGAELVKNAREAAEAADADYASTHAKAVAAGWTAENLANIGYPSPTGHGTRRRAGRRKLTATESVEPLPSTIDPSDTEPSGEVNANLPELQAV